MDDDYIYNRKSVNEMIAFSKLGRYGNLGNQLFQVAFITHFAAKYHLRYELPEWEYAGYFDYAFNISAQVDCPNDLIVYEPSLAYSEEYFLKFLPQMEKDKVDIEGYFQSYLYFSKAHVLEIFKTGNKFRPVPIDRDNSVAISVRRGDFVDHPLYNNIEAGTFLDVLKKFEGFKVHVFSDDFTYCKAHFIGRQFEFMEGLNGIEQLITLSSFDYFVLSNSTFSYWGAMLSPQPKQVYFPYYMYPNIEMCNLYNRFYWPRDNDVYRAYINPINKRITTRF